MLRAQPLFSTLNCKLRRPSPFIATTITHSFADMKSLICVSSITIGLAAAAPLCSNVTNVAGGGLPNSGRPLLLSPAAVKDFQLALFLENLEASYFSSGLSNITKWGTDGYPNDTVEVVSKVAAVSDFPSNPRTPAYVHVARRGPRCNHCRPP